MIVITMELWPKGDKSRAQHLGTAQIINDASGSLARGNYTVTLSRRGKPNSVWKTGEVKKFPRKRFLAWDLLGMALFNILNRRW